MTSEQKQKLFNYFQQEHEILLLDGDFNEIENILGIEQLRTTIEEYKAIAEDAEDSAGALSEQLKDSEEYIKDLQRGCDH